MVGTRRLTGGQHVSVPRPIRQSSVWRSQPETGRPRRGRDFRRQNARHIDCQPGQIHRSDRRQRRLGQCFGKSKRFLTIARLAASATRGARRVSGCCFSNERRGNGLRCSEVRFVGDHPVGQFCCGSGANLTRMDISSRRFAQLAVIEFEKEHKGFSIRNQYFESSSGFDCEGG